MVRAAAAAFLVAHGFAHVVGFLGAWRLGEFRGVPSTSLILDGNLDVGGVGIRVVGLLWLVAAAGLAWASAAVLLRRSHWARTVAIAAVGSLAICIVGLPAAWIGVLVDMAILMVLAAVTLQRRTPAEPRPLSP